MTTAIAIREKQTAELREQITAPEFRQKVELALPGDVTTDRFVQIALTALITNPDIVQCEPESIFSSLLKCAQDGLLPDGREAALAPFNDRQTGKKKAAYMPMVGGFRKIAAESGWSITAKCVYANDEFEAVEGSNPSVTHHPVRPGAERGEIVAVYAIARKRGESPMVTVMSREDVEKRAAIAKTDKFWKGWKPEMYEKTVARNIFGDLPLGDRELARRVLASSSLEPAESTALLYGPVRELTPAPPVDATPEPSIKGDSDGGQQAEEAEANAESALVAQGDASSVPDSVDELRALAKTLGVGEKTAEMIARKDAELEEGPFAAWVARQIAVAKQHIAEREEAEESPFAAMAEKAQRSKAGKQEKLV
jgi:recombination protein RecT